MPNLDDATMQAIEADLAAAHQSLAFGGFDIKGGLVRQIHDDKMRMGATILEIVVPAAAFSYLNAKSAGGEAKIGPVPVDLGIGALLAGLAIFDVLGDWSEDALNVGIGALTAYASRTGAAFGAASVAAATKTAGLPQDAGMLQISGANPAAHNRRMHHHVSGAGMPEISGAMAAGSPIPPGTQRFVVTELR